MGEENEPEDRFERIAKPWAAEVHFLNRSSIPKTLYHYTDAAGLQGMLQNGKIWATDHRFLNDKSEISHTYQTVHDIVMERMAETKDEVLSALYKHILRYQSAESQLCRFIFSLSEEKDDLSQWRGYAREGQGFTIGFSGPKIFKVAEPIDSPFSLMKIEYDHEKQRDALVSALDELQEELKQASGEKGAVPDQLADEVANWFSRIVDVRALTNKHSSFRSEHEWRLVSVVATDDQDNDIKVRSSGLRLVQYIEHSFKSDGGKLPVVSIGIGPGYSGGEEVHAVRSLCRGAGYNPEIYFADTPYRRT